MSRKRKNPPMLRRPSRVREAEGPDFISGLPDCILTSILSLLPIKDSVRSSVFSTRWQHLWKGLPLRFQDSSLKPHLIVSAVSSLSKSHHGPVESLIFTQFAQGSKGIYFPAVDRFLESAAQRGLRELTLEFAPSSPYRPRPCPLPSLVHCKSLHQLSLAYCKLPQPLPPSMFPNVKELRLKQVNLSSDMFQILLSSCQSLEIMYLISSLRCSKVISVRSPTLRKLVWHSQTKELIIEDAPALESLMLSKTTTLYCHVKVVSAPKLQLLGFLSVYFVRLQLGQTLFSQFDGELVITGVKLPHCGVKTLSSVKTLAIKIGPSDILDIIIPGLWRCFPCLENLDILTVGNGYYMDKGFWEEQGTFCFLDHLKTVTVKAFVVHQSSLEFIRYLVTHGKVLRKITILCSDRMTEKLLETIWPQVCMNKRASSDLELFFYEDSDMSNNFSMWDEHI